MQRCRSVNQRSVERHARLHLVGRVPHRPKTMLQIGAANRTIPSVLRRDAAALTAVGGFNSDFAVLLMFKCRTESALRIL